jgi:AAA15 family ATPase/GTPase
MIRYLQLKKYKALDSAEMSELGNINIICGKNNSGKTTIMEALCDKQYYGIGKSIDPIDWLLNLYKERVKQYAQPNPDQAIQWFTQFVDKLKDNKTIWYSYDYGKITNEIQESQKSSLYMRRYRFNAPDFISILDEFFKKDLEFFNPILIPPKRQLEFTSTIELGQRIFPSGKGIINKLFFLKNQDLESEEYKVYRNIYDLFYEITNSRFNIVPDTNNQIVLKYNTNGDWIKASDCGLGLSDVLIILSILNIQNNNVFLIEEPENHLHAEYQKKLLNYIASIKSKQFFISTHSPVFLDSGIVDKIFYCINNGRIQVSDQTSKAEIITSLGYSVAENLVADVIILLEGPTDIPVLQEMLNWFEISSTRIIKYWPLGGDIMAYLDLSVFAEKHNIFALIDSDPGSSVSRTRFIRNCTKTNIVCKKLERYSLENYFPLDSIRKVFPHQIPEKINKLVPNIPVDEQIEFKTKNKTIKNKNAQIVKNMKLSDIEGTDLFDFLNEIKNFLEKN